jgi:hypothetical protein
MWGFVVSYAMMAVAGLIAGAGSLLATGPAGAGPGPLGTGSSGVLIGAGAVACFGGVAVLVFSLWYIRLLYGYRNAFRLAAEEARQLGRDSATPL